MDPGNAEHNAQVHHDQNSVCSSRTPSSILPGLPEASGEEEDQVKSTTENSEAKYGKPDVSSPPAYKSLAGSFRPDPAYLDPTTGLSMSTGAIRARKRRAREREEKERQQKERQRESETVRLTKATFAPANTSTVSLVSHNIPSAAFQEKTPVSVVKDSMKTARPLVYIGDGFQKEINYSSISTNPLAERLIALHRERQKIGATKTIRCSREKERITKAEGIIPQCIPSDSTTASFSGPTSLIASKLPPSFPQEEAFRAISLYSTIRTFSLQLHLSPFTPTAFLCGITCPFMTKLIGEIHVALLRVLFLNIGRGADFYRLASSSLLTSNSKARQGSGLVDPDELMGSECLSYMDAASWPLFYVDYVEATRHKFSELDVQPVEEYPIWKHVIPVPADPRGSVSYIKGIDDDYDDDDATMEEMDHQQVEEIVPKAPPTSEEMKTALLDLLDKISRKADGYGFFSRPVDPIEDQCPDYFEVVDPIHDAMDLGTMNNLVESGEIATMSELELYLQRIVTSSRKYNTDEENFVRKQTERFDTIAQGLVQKAKVSLGCITAEKEDLRAAVRSKEKASLPPSAPAFMRLRTNRNSMNLERKVTRNTLRRRLSLSAADHEFNGRETQMDGEGREKDQITEDDGSQQSRQVSSLSRSASGSLKRKRNSLDPTEVCSQQLVQSMKSAKKRNMRPPLDSADSIAARNELFAMISNSSNINKSVDDIDPNVIVLSEEAPKSIELDTGVSTIPGATGLRENNAEQQGGARRSNRTRIRAGGANNKENAFDVLPHVQAARLMEDFRDSSSNEKRNASCYGALGITAKLDILQFLLDEFIQSDQIEIELTRRHQITQCFQPLEYAPLPKKEDLEHLSNVDDCVVCNYPGDLVCCDGCRNSFHKRCCAYVDSSLARQNSSNDSMPADEKWLCPECRVADSSKLGNLLGGKKSSISWWRKEDLEHLLNLNRSKHQTHDAMQTATQGQIVTDTLADAEPKAGSSCQALSPDFLSGKEFLIVHGFVFQRDVSRDSEPLLLNQAQLYELLRQLGPIVCSEWPWCQVPVNPTDIWDEFMTTHPDTVKATLNKLQFVRNGYASSLASFNPTLYYNLYCKAPPPPAFLQHQPISKSLYQATSPSEQFVANYDQLVSSCLAAGVMEEENPHDNYSGVKLPVLPIVTCDAYNHPSMLSSDTLQRCIDPLAPAKGYLFSLEVVLFRACLLHESWGLDWNKCRDFGIASVFAFKGGKKRVRTNNQRTLANSAINVSWGMRLVTAKTVAQVGKCAVLLIDAVDTKAFYEEWNKIAHKGSTMCVSDNETTTVRPNVDLPESWTIESVLLKRKWERSSDLKEGRRLLIGESSISTDFFPSIGRKRQKAKHPAGVIQFSNDFSGWDSKISSDANFSENTFNSGLRRGRPPKLQTRGTPVKKSTVTEYNFKCVHCMTILSSGLTSNGSQHATRDFFNHLKGCDSCPGSIKDLIGSLRSQKVKSTDGQSFFIALMHRARDWLNSAENATLNGYSCHSPKTKNEASDSKIDTSEPEGGECGLVIRANEVLVQNTASHLSFDESSEELVYSFASNKYALVDPADSLIASKYLVALYKNFLPDSLASGLLKEKRGADISSVDRLSSVTSRIRGHRLVSERYFVACVHCGYIPSFGIKICGPQHATKDLYYHLCDCERCPDNVRSLISKLRSMGLKSHDSGKFFKMHLSRLAQHVNSRSNAQLHEEIVEKMKQWSLNESIPVDFTCDQFIYNFDDSTYPLVKKEDEHIGSLYFAALYKNFWPVGKNFNVKAENEGDVSLVLSLSQKCIEWQVNTKTLDIEPEADPIVETEKQDATVLDEEFHPDEEIFVLNTEELEEGDGNKEEVTKTEMGEENDLLLPNTRDTNTATAVVQERQCVPAKSFNLPIASSAAISCCNQESNDDVKGLHVTASAVELNSVQIIFDEDAAASDAAKLNSDDTEPVMGPFHDTAVQDQTTCAREMEGEEGTQEDAADECDHSSAKKAGRKVRRSGRVQLRSAVQDEIGSYAELPVPAVKTLQHLVTNAAELEAMQKVRSARIANIEKILTEPFEKEIFWPICGRLYIPPTGCLSPAIMRYLGRNAGSQTAPFMLYSDKLEVGKPSVRQRWRSNTLDCEATEELYLQLQILEQHLNRTTVNSSEFIAKRTSSKSSVQRIFCSHRDSATGMIEYFVVNSLRNRGCWVSEDAVDLQALVFMKRDRIEQARKRFQSVINEGTHQVDFPKERAVIDVRSASAIGTVSDEMGTVKLGIAFDSLEKIANHHPSTTASIMPSRPDPPGAPLSRVEEQLVNQLRQVLHKHQSDTHELFKSMLDTSTAAVHEKLGALRRINRHLIDSANAPLRQLGSRMCMPDELISSKMSEAELFAKRKVEDEWRNRQSNKSPFTLLTPNGQGVSDLEIAVEKAYIQHQVDTRSLLAAAAEAGLKSVPVDSMNAVRTKNLRQMQSANAALQQVGSPKALTEAELVQKIQSAETVAQQCHLAEERRKHAEARTASSVPSQHAISGANRATPQQSYYPVSNSNFTAADAAARSRQPQQTTYQAFASNNYSQMNRPPPQSIPQLNDYKARETHSAHSSATGQMPGQIISSDHPQSLNHHLFQNNNAMLQLNLATNNIASVNRQNHFVGNQSAAPQRHFQTMPSQQGVMGQNVPMMQQLQSNRQHYNNMLQNPSVVQQPHGSSAHSSGQSFNAPESIWKT